MELWQREIGIGDRQTVHGWDLYPLVEEEPAAPTYLTCASLSAGGLLVVGEFDPPEVAAVAVRNRGDVPVLLLAGELLLGGVHDRLVRESVLCPPGTTVVDVSAAPARTSAVERSGSGPGPGPVGPEVAPLRPTPRDGSSRQQAGGPGPGPRTSVLERPGAVLPAGGRPAEAAMHLVVHQVGMACTYGGRVVGIELVDRPATLVGSPGRVVPLRPAPDPSPPRRPPDAFRTIRRELARLGAARPGGPAVGLGRVVRFDGPLVGSGLVHEGRLLHLAVRRPGHGAPPG